MKATRRLLLLSAAAMAAWRRSRAAEPTAAASSAAAAPRSARPGGDASAAAAQNGLGGGRETPQQRMQRYQQQLETGRRMFALWTQCRDQAAELVAMLATLRHDGPTLAALVTEAAQAIDRAAAAMPLLQATIAAAAPVRDALRQQWAATQQALERLATADAGSPAALAATARAADAALDARRARERALREHSQTLRRLLAAVDAETRRGQPLLDDAYTAREQLSTRMQRAGQLDGQLRATLRDLVDAQAAASRTGLSGWPQPPAMPQMTPAWTVLIDATAGAPALVRSGRSGRSPLSSAKYTGYDPARLAFDWLQLQDASGYLRLSAGRESQHVDAAERAALETSLRNVEAALDAAPQALARVSAVTARWLAEGLQADALTLQRGNDEIQPLLVHGLAEIEGPARTVADMARVVTAALDAATLQRRAIEQIQQSQNAQYKRIGGGGSNPAPTIVPAPKAAPPQAPTPPPDRSPGPDNGPVREVPTQVSPLNGEALPSITGHAWQDIERFDDEDEGYAAYTYVLLRSAADLQTPAVQRRHDALLKLLREQTSAADVAPAQRERLHLFCVPVATAPPRSDADRRYNGLLGNQIKLQAQTGLLLRPELLDRLTRSPGPFLLTLPTRAAQARSGTVLLFADLAPYDEATVQDLATAYMAGLLLDFPRQQMLWKPPVMQRVALSIFQLAQSTGTLVTALLPGAVAKTR